ncbi:lumenal Hsp70 protein [Sorochytrium milnesiophthora]
MLSILLLAVSLYALLAPHSRLPRAIFGPSKDAWLPALWHAVDDRVRGGQSHSYLTLLQTEVDDPVVALFHGTLDIDTLGGAGFASQRIQAPDHFHSVLGGIKDSETAIRLAVSSKHSDDKRYSLNLYKHQAAPSERQVEFKAYFNASATVELEWTAFKPHFNGRPVERAHDGSGRVGNHTFPPADLIIHPRDVVAMSVMCSSGFGKQQGNFTLGLSAITRLLAALCLLPVFAPARAAVLGIDYGAQWFKVALVKPGVPLDMVLNRESKRKTASIVTVRDSQRLFGTDSVNLAARFPQHTYPNLKSLLGRLYADDEHALQYRKLYGASNMISHPQRGTVAFQHSDDLVFTVEELVAMQLQHAREQAEAAANEPCKEAVITIPPFFNQFERQALVDAAQLAGLRVLALIHDETAVAINYALGRTFDSTPQYHIFYDMGAGSTVATLVKFNGTRTTTHISVLAVGSDRTLGGDMFDAVLYQHLAAQFQKQFGSKLEQPVEKNSRAVAKLWKEAGRVKHILSANTETQAAIESLHEDHDFRLKITRQEFEQMLDKHASALDQRIGAPIQQVLAASNVSMNDVSSVVLVGGGLRVPKVQAVLKDVAGEEKLAKNVNGDEAAVMGAAFRAAGISPRFRVKDLRIRDANPYTIAVEHTAPAAQDSNVVSTPRMLVTKLYPTNARLDTEKYLTFRRTADLDFMLRYTDLDPSLESTFGPTDLYRVSVKGVADLADKHKDKVIGKPEVRVGIKLDQSGLLSVTGAYANIKSSSKDAAASAGAGAAGSESGGIKEKLLNFVGLGNKNEQEETDQNAGKEAETVAGDDQSKPTSPASSQPGSNDTAAPTTVTEKFKLKVTAVPQGVPSLTDAERATISARLAKWDKQDSARKAREEARNELEGFIYHVREKMYETLYEAVTTAEQREHLAQQVREHADWLDSNNDEDDSTLAQVKQKLSALRNTFDPVTKRAREHTTRPAALATLVAALDAVKDYISTTRGVAPANRGATDDDLSALQLLADDIRAFVAESTEAFNKLLPHEDAAVSVADLHARAQMLKDETARLVRKVVPKKTTTSTTTTTTTATSAEEQPTDATGNETDHADKEDKRPLDHEEL